MSRPYKVEYSLLFIATVIASAIISTVIVSVLVLLSYNVSADMIIIEADVLLAMIIKRSMAAALTMT